MRGHYNKASYDSPAREWLQRWCDVLDTYTATNVRHISEAKDRA
jgi:hypothetical protein